MIMMREKNALIIFVKNPVLGKVKTRLAQTVGDESALVIYQKLLEHTHQITGSLACNKFVFYSDYINENDLWENDSYRKRMQIGHDLGEKMSHAFQSLFDQGFEKIVIIGSDAYDLRTEDIDLAFEELEKHNVVIGPAIDGGYYLLGMGEMIPALFQDKSWSSEVLIQETEEEIKRSFKTYIKLRKISDVDYESDLGDLSQYVISK